MPFWTNGQCWLARSSVSRLHRERVILYNKSCLAPIETGNHRSGEGIEPFLVADIPDQVRSGISMIWDDFSTDIENYNDQAAAVMFSARMAGMNY